MATTIVSNLVVFSDASGAGNQSHLVYAANQGRWWLFVIKTKTATVVSSYVSSSNDLTTATWATSTDSPAFPTSRALSTNDQRNLACLSLTNGSTDAVHVSVGIGPSASGTGYTEHIRATFTGTSAITWESWGETASAAVDTWGAVKGNALGKSTDGHIHESNLSVMQGQDANARLSTNVDTGATWTTGFGAIVFTDSSMANFCNAYAYAPLASAAMALVYDNGGAARPNGTGLRYNKYTSGTSWPTTASADVGIGTTSQDFNDWCLCGVDTTHVYAFRRSGTNTFVWRKFDGTSWTTPTNGVPNQNHKAGSGLFAATNGTDLYLFLLDSATNNPVQYCKASGVNGTTPTWGAWTQLEAAGSAARNYISGYPVVANNQIGVIFTVVNGSNFDIAVSALSLGGPAFLAPRSQIIPQAVKRASSY
jgi:hypothetical protein